MLEIGISSLSFASIPFIWNCPPYLSKRFYILSMASVLYHLTYDYFQKNPEFKYTKRIVELLDGLAIIYSGSTVLVASRTLTPNSKDISLLLFYLFPKLICDNDFIKQYLFLQLCGMLSYKNPATILPLTMGAFGYYDSRKRNAWTLKNRLLWHVNISMFLGFSVKFMH